MISQVQIETSSLCSAKCIFCPHKDLKRKTGFMSDFIFNKIISGCRSEGVASICPFLNGEMFTDPKIFERLEIINKELPKTKIVIFSNMSLLDAEKINKLSNIKNIAFFGMSLTHYDEESCKFYMGLDFNVVYRNVMNLLATNKNKKFIGRIQISSIDAGDVENKKFRTMWGGISGVERMFISARQNWLGKIKSSIPINNNRVCPRAFHLCILSDGRVPLCCFDAESTYQVGDINTQTVSEVYHSEKYRAYRNNIKSDLTPCKWCTQ